ncbi:MAG: diacylglycerol kinase family protein [Eubacterium sp.]
MNYIVLYNPLSNGGKGKEKAEEIKNYYNESKLEYQDITELENLSEFIHSDSGRSIILCGGDGTLHYFVNYVDCDKLETDVFYYPAGSGNDFKRDTIGTVKEYRPYKINKYLKKLPFAEVNGKKYRYINGIGFGIDSFACVERERVKAKNPDKKINYTGIVIKTWMFDYKPIDAVITIDGKKYTYKDVWICPAMKCKSYGGGMIVAPNQDRLDETHSLSITVFHGRNKLRIAYGFFHTFSASHLKYKDICTELKGKKITVEFAQAAPVQIDGELIGNSKTFTAWAE